LWTNRPQNFRYGNERVSALLRPNMSSGLHYSGWCRADLPSLRVERLMGRRGAFRCRFDWSGGRAGEWFEVSRADGIEQLGEVVTVQYAEFETGA
jgi:hypothetical protein